MMRSLSSAVSGLRSHQTRMDVIGNNIANVNTYGFKSSRVTFSDVYYQTLSSGSAPTSTMGGTNPTQIGYGSKVATIDVLNTASSMASTDRSLDMYINGDGMIATKDADGNLRYSRLGILGFDADGYLVDVNGNFVMGFPTDRDGNPQVNPDGSCNVDDLSKIRINPEYADDIDQIAIDKTGQVIGTMAGDANVKQSSGLPAWIRDIIVPPDSNLSGPVNITMEYRYTSATATPTNANWITNVTAAVNSGVEGTYTFTYDADGMIRATNSTTGEVLTGEYVRGADVKLYRAGEAVMTITTDSYNIPTAGNYGTMTFAKSQWISFTGTDKGGNKLGPGGAYSVEYKNQDKVTLGEGTTQIEVLINRNAVETAKEFSFSLNQSHNLTWLDGVYLSSNPDAIRDGNIYLEYGVEYAITSQLGTGTNAANWLPQAAMDAMMQKYCNTNGEADFGYRVIVTPGADPATDPDDYVFEIFAKSGTTETTIAKSNTYTKTQLDNTTTTPDITFTDPFNMFGSTATFTIPNTYNTADNPNHGTFDYSIGKGKGENIVQIKDGGPTGDILDRTVYTSGDIDFGDILITVKNPNVLLDFFALGTALSANPNNKVIGTVTSADVPQWLFDKQAGNVEIKAGEQIKIGVIALASVPNMAAMLQDGESYFLESGNSGEASFWKAGTGNVGTLDAGYLEQSNVDISKEFTDMITTQRGFQANTRIITVSDEMLQELVNLKR